MQAGRVPRAQRIYIRPRDKVIKPIHLTNGLNRLELNIELVHSASVNDFETVQELIRMGADPDYVGPRQSALCWAIFNNNDEMAKFLIDEMSLEGLNKLNTMLGETALHKAISHKLLDVVYYLIIKGVDVNKPTYQGTTALDLANMTHDKAIIDLVKRHSSSFFCSIL